ncbi:MAG: phosphoribosylanthranilate isomerase [Planctomycetales bacterium]
MWVKICGIRDEATARMVAAAAPDAVGLNFHPPSRRFVERETAARIVRALPESIAAVGVFVNASAADILATSAAAGIATAQLHGDEPPALLAELRQRNPSLRLIRAHRFGAEGIEPLVSYLEECRRLDAVPDACLIDADVPGAYGGTGRTVAWDALAEACRSVELPPLILAGGLTPENVSRGIAAVAPWGVDVAGGVESSPGDKDAALVARFIAAARATPA